MTSIPFTPSDYLSYTLVSKKKRLLVEGPDDNRFFNRLLDRFDKSRTLVDVDDARMLQGFNQITSNRDKVEAICELINETQFADKLVGFVDREYRGFIIADELRDSIGDHYVNGRLVWSRGHSIENYYFEFDILSDPFAALSTTSYYSQASRLFEMNLETIIRIACAAGLTGEEIGNFQILKSNISWDTYDFTDNILSLNLSLLEIKLQRMNVPPKMIDSIKDRLPFWIHKVNKVDFDVVRWLCHGHLGLAFIWAAYKKCVYVSSLANGCLCPEAEVSHTLEARDEMKFLACARRRVEKVPENGAAFPFIGLNMLNLI